MNKTLGLCAQDPSTVMTGNAQGYPVGQIFNDAFKVFLLCATAQSAGMICACVLACSMISAYSLTSFFTHLA